MSDSRIVLVDAVEFENDPGAFRLTFRCQTCEMNKKEDRIEQLERALENCECERSKWMMECSRLYDRDDMVARLRVEIDELRLKIEDVKKAIESAMKKPAE